MQFALDLLGDNPERRLSGSKAFWHQDF